MSSAPLIIRQAGEGEQFWFAGGGTWTIKVGSADTGGSALVIEDRMDRGKTTPLHRHPDFEETLYVIEGEILVHAHGEDHAVGAGGIAMAPRGVAHAFLVTSDTARVLAVLTPGAGEAFYRALSEPIVSPEDARRPPDFERVREEAERSEHIEIIGPPPFSISAHRAGPGA